MTVVELRDGRLTWWAWCALDAVGQMAGVRYARWLASMWQRRQATDGAAFMALASRISPRLRSENPQLYKVPESWLREHPVVNVRRLGLKWTLDLRDNLQALLYFSGTYEPDLLAFLRRQVRQGDVFVDVGANIGLHSLVVADALRSVGGGEVYAFEPAPDSANRIRATAARNGLDVSVVEAALGAEAGVIELRADPVYGLHDTGVRSQHNLGEVVGRASVVTFDGWVEDHGLRRVDLVKIDVEGDEPEVLGGMRRMLQRLRPQFVIVEVKEYSFERAGSDVTGIRQMLQDAGYESSGKSFHHNEVFRPMA